MLESSSIKAFMWSHCCIIHRMSVILNLGCILESPGKYIKIPMLGCTPASLNQDFWVEDSGICIFQISSADGYGFLTPVIHVRF